MRRCGSDIASRVDVVDRITIRPYDEADNIEELTELLHRAYAGLAAMGFRYWATFQGPDITRDRLNGRLSFMAELDGVIIGTITLYDRPSDDKCLTYRRPDVAKFGQFGVEPQYQSSGIGGRMMDLVEETAKAMGFAELACDTASTATHLVEWYIRRGYTIVEEVQWDLTNYKSVVLSKQL